MERAKMKSLTDGAEARGEARTAVGLQRAASTRMQEAIDRYGINVGKPDPGAP